MDLRLTLQPNIFSFKFWANLICMSCCNYFIIFFKVDLMDRDLAGVLTRLTQTYILVDVDYREGLI